SVELCGGTHVKNTRDIWHFIITSEGAVAAGVRRIEAITYDTAQEYFTTQTEAFHQVKEALKGNSADPLKAVTALQEENSALKKQVEQLLKEKAKGLKSELKASLESIDGVQFLATEVDLDQGSIKDLAFELGSEYDNLFLLFGSNHNDKAMLSCYISKDLVKQRDLNAGTIVRELGKLIQGGGGGRPFFATAGGKNAAGIREALKRAKSYIQP